MRGVTVMKLFNTKLVVLLSAISLSIVMIGTTGCGHQAPPKGDIIVNSYKLSSSDVQTNSSYTGTIIAQNKTAIHARVTGYVIEKYVKGGDHVVAGQPLYKLDSRQYEADLASAQARVARSTAAYENARRDLERYQRLANDNAIAQQTVDTQAATTEQSMAAVHADEAAMQIAENNVSDTIVYAPFTGTLEMNDVDLGTYVTGGQTTLVTIDSIDPIFVQFSLTETEYLSLMKEFGLGANNKLQLKLGDGSLYPYMGTIMQSAKTLDPGTGKLIIKASFPNPDGLLIPNMFATVMVPGQVVNNAILVPSRAIVQVLDKNFIYSLDENGKVTQKPIEIAGTQGIYTIVKSGISTGDEIVVDGITKIKNGAIVKAKCISKNELESTGK